MLLAIASWLAFETFNTVDRFTGILKLYYNVLFSSRWAACALTSRTGKGGMRNSLQPGRQKTERLAGLTEPIWLLCMEKCIGAFRHQQLPSCFTAQWGPDVQHPEPRVVAV